MSEAGHTTPGRQETVAATATGPRGAFAYRDYRLFFAGQLFSSSGLWLRILVQGWLALELTGSATWLGIVTFLSTFPTLLLTPLGGALADRWDRRIMLIVANTGIAALLITLGVLTFTGAITLPLLCILVLIQAVLFGFDQPPRQAIVVNLVDPPAMVPAVALHSANFTFARFLGPLVGGLVVPLAGIAAGFFTAGIGYVTFVLTLLPVRLRNVERAPGGEMISSIRNGFGYAIRNRPILGFVLMSAAMNAFASPFQYLVPAFARDVLGTDAGGLGALLAVAGFASFISAGTLAWFGRRIVGGTVSVWMAVATLGASIVFCLTTSMGPALVMIFALSFLGQMFYTMNASLIQLATSDAMRGRIMGIFTLTWHFHAIAAIPVGFFGDMIGIAAALAIWSAIGITAVIGLAIAFPEIRRISATSHGAS